MINFMLPTQIGAMTIDGTWLIVFGIIIVAGIIYKNRENISLTSSETNKNNDSNINSTLDNIKTDIQTTEVVDNNTEVFNEEQPTLEKEKILN